MSCYNQFQIRAVNRKIIDFNCEKEKQWKEPFIFIQSADTQFGFIDKCLNIENPKWDKEIALTSEAIKAVNAMTPKPRFFVICGDLVDALPSQPNRKQQIADFKDCFRELRSDIPLICVCGNHDVDNTPTHDSVSDYRKTFGDDYFSFSCGGVLFVAINSQYYKDCSVVRDLADEQNVWLDEVLRDVRLNQYKHVLLFQHIPWFLSHADEPNDYFNIDKQIRDHMLSKFYESGVRAIFCGHYHRNAGGKYNDMEVVVTSAIGAQLGSDKSGLRVVKVLDHSIQHQYYNIGEIPINITF